MRAFAVLWLRPILGSQGSTARHLPFWYHYSAMFNFKQVFRQTRHAVKTQYPAARFDLTNKGVTLLCSPPPIAKRLVAVSQTAANIQPQLPPARRSTPPGPGR